MRAFMLSLLALMMSIASAQSATFEVGKGAFLLDGELFVVKAFDLQESTYWLSASSAPYPHRLVIDLGAERTMRALQYLPRMETSAPGSIKDTKIYIY